MNQLQVLQDEIEARIAKVGGEHPLTLVELLEIVEEASNSVSIHQYEEYMGEDL